jgi:hypothetical protein
MAKTITLTALTWLTVAVLALPAEAAAPITKREAVKTARWSASEYLAMAGIPFHVEPRDWQVRCRRRGRWICRVEQGPCSGRLRIERVTRGGGLRGIGRVGCVAD